MTDMHTHSSYSPDGRATLSEMADAAQRLGLRYFGISEHFDFDFLSPAHFAAGGGPFVTTDPESYFPAAQKEKRLFDRADCTLLIGGEFGFCPDPAVQSRLAELFKRYAPDFVINSVHIIDGCDVCFSPFFAGKSKREAYGAYLTRVLESLSARYPYDIVGHIGYPSRNAPYPDRAMRYEEFPSLYDEILRTIIARDKILEVNGSAEGSGGLFLPEKEVLARYFALGGRKVSFGSDAHEPGAICKNREAAAAALKEIGFRCLTVPVRGTYLQIAL